MTLAEFMIRAEQDLVMIAVNWNSGHLIIRNKNRSKKVIWGHLVHILGQERCVNTILYFEGLLLGQIIEQIMLFSAAFSNVISYFLF